MKNSTFSLIVFIVLLLLTSFKPSGKSKLELNPLFSNHMVLQQKENIAFFGNTLQKQYKLKNSPIHYTKEP